MTEPQCTGEKRCASCGDLKPALAFGTNRKCSDGLQTICRDCHADNLRKTLRGKRKLRPAEFAYWQNNEPDACDP